MSYATRADMEARFGEKQVESLAADPQDSTVDRTVSALADAAAEIDAFLATAYALPLSTDVGWPLLKAIACDNARARLFDKRPTKAPSEAMSRGIRRLEGLRDGKVNLVDSTGKVAPRINTAEVIGPDPKFTAEALEGF